MSSIENDVAQILSDLQSESDRGLALVAAAHLDQKLEGTISAFFCETKSSKALINVPYAPLGTLSAKIDICQALGLIDDYEYAETHAIRRIRNIFAHSDRKLDFADSQVAKECAKLTSEYPIEEGKIVPSRALFLNAAVKMSLHLYYRANLVTKERRVQRSYVTKDQTRWRSLKNETPKNGDSAILLFQEEKGRR